MSRERIAADHVFGHHGEPIEGTPHIARYRAQVDFDRGWKTQHPYLYLCPSGATAAKTARKVSFLHPLADAQRSAVPQHEFQTSRYVSGLLADQGKAHRPSVDGPYRLPFLPTRFQFALPPVELGFLQTPLTAKLSNRHP